ncbi:methyl-accepting chemotaxis protein [Ideonella sp. A 288]|uniref:methyl-accepting chemotaxis protein n=1 Tax=Ideonella sp. A 288 TaxID=1962181 RepID=UPI000B4B5607|nr:methyl-accepting chemotaxis protein [Ideonella sp. A 288]
MNPLDLRIGPRVALAFGAVIVMIMLLVAAVQLTMARTAENSVEMGRGVALQAQASETHLLAKDNAIAGMVFLVSSSEEQQKRLLQEMRDRDQRIVTNLGALEKALAGSAEDAALVVDIRKRHATYQAGVKRIVDMVQGGKQTEATFAADEEMIPMLAPFLAGLGKLDARQVARVHATEAANEQLIGSSQWKTIGAGLVTMLLAAATGGWLVLGLTRPLAHAVDIAERVAAGDLTTETDARGRDEVAQLLRALNRMSGSLSTLVQQVRTAADGIATGSQEIATGNADLSQRTELQASALQQTASSMSDLGSAVTHNADNARQANQFALGASTVAVKGGEVVGQVVETMKGIHHSSQKIADIIGVIDGIAFQTNILALNAAVEAARAGEQGRGFAVVAGEVRGLAQRSADAAREIKQLISASVEQVERGSTLVDQAGATMHEIVSSVSRVSDIMNEINAATGAQSNGVAQVSEAVSRMDQSTQQNAALVEQSAAAAESLNQQAQRLVHAVSVFKLGAG